MKMNSAQIEQTLRQLNAEERNAHCGERIGRGCIRRTPIGILNGSAFCHFSRCRLLEGGRHDFHCWERATHRR